MAEDADRGIQAPGRRAFLRLTAAAGGASLLSACSSSRASTTSATTTDAMSTGAVSTGAKAASGPPTSADWAALARDLSGPLIRPGESGYNTAKELFDPRFD